MWHARLLEDAQYVCAANGIAAVLLHPSSCVAILDAGLRIQAEIMIEFARTLVITCVIPFHSRRLLVITDLAQSRDVCQPDAMADEAHCRPRTIMSSPCLITNDDAIIDGRRWPSLVLTEQNHPYRGRSRLHRRGR